MSHIDCRFGGSCHVLPHCCNHACTAHALNRSAMASEGQGASYADWMRASRKFALATLSPLAIAFQCRSPAYNAQVWP